MSSILEGELADTIGDALLDAAIPLDVVITRSTPGVHHRSGRATDR
jgi:hypothetical protein